MELKMQGIQCSPNKEIIQICWMVVDDTVVRVFDGHCGS